MTASIKLLVAITLFTLLSCYNTKGHSQCISSQLGDNIRFASTFDEQVGFANNISKDGTTILVGAVNGSVGGSRVGRVGIFSLNSSSQWIQKGQELSGVSASNRFGASVAINENGTFAIVGATATSGAGGGVGGYASIYQFQSNSWVLYGQQLSGFATGDAFGFAVDISSDGQTVIIGGPANDAGGLNAGIAGVYQYNSTSMMWELKGPLITGDLVSFKGAGSDVSISDDGSVVGIASNLNTRIYQFDSSNNDWDQLGNDIADDATEFFPSTISLSEDGMTVAVGNSNFGGFNGDVSIYEFDTDNNTWEIIGGPILGTSEFRPLGATVSLNAKGTIVATGGTSYGPPFTNRDKGSTLLYQLDTSANSWNQLIDPILGTERDERSGFSVGISGDGLRVISGAPFNSNDGNAFFGGQSVVYNIDTSSCDGCAFSTDTTFVSITIPCNSKLQPPKALDMCVDSLLCGIPLDSSFYFAQDTFMTQWTFTSSDGIMDTVLQEIIVDGIIVCDTVSTGIGSLRNALDCAEEGDTIDIFDGLMNDTLILESEGLTIDENVIIEVDPSDNITIDASMAPSAFTISVGSTLTLDGIRLIMGHATLGGAAVNDGTLNLLNTMIFPHPTDPGGSQFSGGGDVNISPETVIFPNLEE